MFTACTASRSSNEPETFAARPAAHTRIGDAERERTLAALRRHAADGRLTLEEFEDRVAEVFAATHRRDLDRTLRELPAVRVADPVANGRRRREVSRHVITWAAIAALMLLLWVVTGMGYFWPVWPIAGTAVGMVKHVAAARSATYATVAPVPSAA